MNFIYDNRRSAAIGLGLIVLGFVWWWNLWWLLLPGMMIAGGVAAYLQRRATDTSKAIQASLWLVGLGLLILIDFLFPGVLFLAGLSILARGHEDTIDSRLQRWFGGLRHLRRSNPPATVSQVPITVHPGESPRPSVEQPATGETTRLRE